MQNKIKIYHGQVLNQLPAKVPRTFSILKNQEMHEFRDDMDASLRSGAEGLSAVMWHDIVQVNNRPQILRIRLRKPLGL